jgi:hypothetical protein
MEVTEKLSDDVTATTQNSILVNLISTTLIFTKFFMGRIP